MQSDRAAGSAPTELLDELFVLVELFEVLYGHLIDSQGLGLFAVLVISQHADHHLWPRRVRKLDRSAKPLIFLRVSDKANVSRSRVAQRGRHT